VAPGFKKWYIGFLDPVLAEAFGENLAENTAVLQLM
jgi:hypothetical protein